MSDFSTKDHGWLRDLFEELKRRRVIRVATLYIVAFWPVIQIVDILSPTLSLPDSAMRYLVLAFAGGLPVVLVFAWIFDLNQGGIIRSDEVPEGGRALIGSKVELGIVGIMLAVVAGLFYVQMNIDEGHDASNAATLAASGPSRAPSIAVLPFVSFSVEDRDRYFADGLTEELLNVLSSVSGLQVAARTSSFAYRGVNKPVQDIGRELNVDVILEGSVRRNDVDDTIRVTAQLVDSRTGNHYFSNTFDRRFTDIFKIQDEIAAAVVNELKVTLLKGEEQNIKSHASASPEAMITYAMGQTELGKRSKVATSDAIRLFKRAIDLDENYAEAWVGLADANTLTASYGWGDKTEHLAAAQTAVDKALALKPDLGSAWASQGLIYRNTMRPQDAITAFERALVANPSYAMAHMWYAATLTDPDLRLKHFERAYELDPKSPVAGFNIAQEYINRDRESEAMQVFSQIIEADPFYPQAYLLVARISADRGRLGEAIRQLERAYELAQGTDAALSIASLYTSMGDFGPAAEWVARVRSQLSPQHFIQLDLMDFQRLAMQGEYGKARQTVMKLATPRDESPLAYLTAVFAAYMAGEFETAITNWEAALARHADHEDLMILSSDMALTARLAAAYSYQQVGETGKAAETLTGARQMLDEVVAGGRHGSGIWYQYATLELMEGHNQLALINMQRAINEGWREYWMPGIDPAFAELVAERELSTMIAGLETQMALMREQLAFEQSFASARTDTSADATGESAPGS